MESETIRSWRSRYRRAQVSVIRAGDVVESLRPHRAELANAFQEALTNLHMEADKFHAISTELDEPEEGQ